ncbi:DUF3524 domain-containing protein [Gilvimarinus sp. DA14]|uniref:tRNA-queuosine alpha-mannosyltransferase domain-containing protein n=1 Tax=Gilvimarinus sp. DA14 TaxID=2956798 RepID=UPI0020B8FF83|nr:DUF3524 domain-containing protein [Gilvimarinus sp. DA14]UTF60832.1 DUF3524 domain-containing protein [Gilvimarinus sp. DA14]
MRVLVISGYDAASHKRWRQGLEVALPDIAFTHIALPPRYFSWRIRGNSLSLATLYRDSLEAQYDVLLVTSMVDLSSLRGMVPALAGLPTLVYFHENQFAYPPNENQTPSVEPQIVTLYAAVCADRVVFNTEFNRSSFLFGVKQLMAKLPDLVPQGLELELAKKSRVIPVPLETELYHDKVGGQNEKPQMVWNHRWEYDKNPDLLLAALKLLQKHYGGHLPFTLHVVGQRFRTAPPAFAKIKLLLQETGALGQWGYMEDLAGYRALLQSCQWVLSTADHDFQGLSVLEAVAAGCVPVLPRRQVYPEFFDLDYCYNVTGDLNTDARSLADKLLVQLQQTADGNPLRHAPDVSDLSWSRLAPVYRSLLTDLATHTGKGSVL